VLIPFGPISGMGRCCAGIHGTGRTRCRCCWREGRCPGLSVRVPVLRRGDAVVSRDGVVHDPEQVAILKKIATTLRKQGFTRAVLVGGTTPESYGARWRPELYDETEEPYLFLDCSRLGASGGAEDREGYPGSFGETLICLAALKLLGARGDPAGHVAKEIKQDEDGTCRGDPFGRGDAAEAGMVGWRYHQEKNHGNTARRDHAQRQA